MQNGLGTRTKEKERTFRESMIRMQRGNELREACLCYVNTGITDTTKMPIVQELLGAENPIARPNLTKSVTGR